jgi:hypothetical protein
VNTHRGADQPDVSAAGPPPSGQRTLRLHVDVVLGAEPVRGSIHDGSGARVSFRSWLQLIDAIERLRAASAASRTGLDHG